MAATVLDHTPTGSIRRVAPRSPRFARIVGLLGLPGTTKRSAA